MGNIPRDIVNKRLTKDPEWAGATWRAVGPKSLVITHPTNPNKRSLMSNARRMFSGDAQSGYSDMANDWETLRPADPDAPAKLRVQTDFAKILVGASGSLAVNAGPLVRLEFPGGEGFSIMPPSQLQWVNNVGGIEPIRNITSAVGVPGIADNDNIVTWTDAYGPGIDLVVSAGQDEYFKSVVVDDASLLGTSSLSNPTHMRMSFTFTRSSVRVFYFNEGTRQYTEWGEGARDDISTTAPLQFRAANGTTVLFTIKVPFIKAHNPILYNGRTRIFRGGVFQNAQGEVDKTYSWIELERAGQNRIVHLCFDYDYIQAHAGAGTIEFDPSIDTEPIDDASDGELNTFGSWNTGKNWADIQAAAGANHVSWGAWFDFSAIGADTVTIDDARLTVSFGTVNGANELTITTVADSDNPPPTTTGQANTAFSMRDTANQVLWSPDPSSSVKDQVSPDLSATLQATVNTGDVGDVGFWMYAGAGSTNYAVTVGYLIGYATYQPSVQVDYTISGGGSGQRIILVT